MLYLTCATNVLHFDSENYKDAGTFLVVQYRNTEIVKKSFSMVTHVIDLLSLFED